jgi:uncharacterized protein (DUF952 family)
MPAQPDFLSASPVIPVLDLAAALDRYRALGFEVRAHGGGTGYGFANRGAVSLHLSEWDEHDPTRTGAVVYLYVADVDTVHAEWGAARLEGRLTPPTDTDHGMREFAYVDPDGTLHRVGTRLELFHLALTQDWRQAQAVGEYTVSTIGRTLEAEGFIHCSYAHQVPGVADRFYRGRDDVLLLSLDRSQLAADVRLEEVVPGGEHFPHIYGPIPVAAVRSAEPYPINGV